MGPLSVHFLNNMLVRPRVGATSEVILDLPLITCSRTYFFIRPFLDF